MDEELQTLIVSRQFCAVWDDALMELKLAIARRDRARAGTKKWHEADADVQRWGRDFRFLEKIYDAAGGPRT